ncbi:PTS transporter subunit EIIC [Gemella sp. GH3]|uniref:alpha-glucoside-specific PTS transporter subunit IIBC n=1 Tax=unclassified Gemella TaxID=2624949 RepID=UPI0015D034D4|nr:MULTISPECIES: alpha-glucoside-specific PTS transporter subunit IIBC [unclassified Gemella]MBF0713788.1 PTS transporter subunit EIIC [Gemella sp. GH3.1]NYS50740.1 PTS transporter subunit EIIC [Gemella sp. GH3]
MLQKLQRFGGAMLMPSVLFAFAGLVVGLTSILKNPDLVGSIAQEGTNWFKFWFVVEQGGWTLFNQMPIVFALGIPIGLAKKANGRAALEAFVIYMTFNYFINAFLTQFTFFGIEIPKEGKLPTGLTQIGGVTTLDTSIIGSIVIASIAVWIHNKYFDKKLPELLGIFQGTSFVIIVGFLIMLPVAFLTALLWPKVQLGIAALQGLLKASGVIGVFLYTLLERLLIPTGLHHFIYGPFMFGPAVVENGITAYWATHIQEFANNTAPLKEQFSQGGFSLHGNSKVFGLPAAALAMYVTAKDKKKKIVAGLLLPAALTGFLTGITEPIEFTFLFAAPVLFIAHAVLGALMSSIMYALGVVGNFGSGLIDFLSLNWLPMFSNHSSQMFIQIGVGLTFSVIYFLVFRFLILKLNLNTPGRESEDSETKLYTKQDYRNKDSKKDKTIVKDDSATHADQAAIILEGLGGKDNIAEVTNCVTRLRVNVKDETLVKDDNFLKQSGALGVARNDKAIQVIIGFSVGQVREEFEKLL